MQAESPQRPPPPPATQRAAPPRPPSEVAVTDLPNDDGTGLVIQWTLSPDDTADAKPRIVGQYNVERKVTDESDARFELIGEANFGESSLEDKKCQRGKSYMYRVIAVALDTSRSEPAEAGQAAPGRLAVATKPPRARPAH